MEIKREDLFWLGYLNEGVYLEDMSVDGRIILTETMDRIA
jgi:hypothetical protein